MSKKIKTLTWYKPERRRPFREMKAKIEAFTVSEDNPALPDPAIAESPLSKLIGEVGIPIFSDVSNIKEYTIELLKLASEIEHALMVQYLYACYSVPNVKASDGVNYRRKILNIAIQEMGHLATVQNLLLAVGGPENFYVQRDRLRSGSSINPIPFVTEPLNIKSLAQYVIAEQPADESIPDEVKPLVDRLREIVKGTDIHRVGIIYELLRWIFTPKAEAEDINDLSLFVPFPVNPHLDDSDLTPKDVLLKFEASREEWDITRDDVVLQSIHSCKEAVDAINNIAEQGEGILNKDISHFGEFLEIVTAFEAGTITVTRMATAPTLGMNGSLDGILIEHPYTRLWGEVFSIQYSLLILSIHHGLLTERIPGEFGLREKLIEMALLGMRDIIGEVTKVMSGLRINTNNEDVAGPPYDLVAEVLDVNTREEMPVIHLKLLDRLENLYAAIESSVEFPNFPAHKHEITSLRVIDKERRELFVTPA